VIYKLALLETCPLYKILDNAFGKVFKNYMKSLLIVSQIRHVVKCTFLSPKLSRLGECVRDITMQVVPCSLVSLGDDSNTSN